MQFTTFIIHDAFEQKAQCDVLYSDARKAFDVVHQQLLTSKLAKFPLANSVLKWRWTGHCIETADVLRIFSDSDVHIGNDSDDFGAIHSIRQAIENWHVS